MVSYKLSQIYNNIRDLFFRYLLFYMKPDTTNITISGITDLEYTFDYNVRLSNKNENYASVDHTSSGPTRFTLEINK